MEAIELKHVLAGDTLRYAGAGFPGGLYTIRLPKGTSDWGVGVQTGRLPVASSVLMAFDAPPVRAKAEAMGSDSRKALPRLWAGATLYSESQVGGDTLNVSQYEAGSPWRADRERVLYLQFDFGGHACLGMQSRIFLDLAYAADLAPPQPAPAPAPPAPAPAPAPSEPDLALAQRTLAYAHAAGLVAALMKTSGAHSEEALIDWVLLQGDLWFAICRLAGLAEKGQQA